MKSKIYADEYVKNKESKPAAGNHYYPCKIVINNNTYKGLFTRNQLDVAIARAVRNPEDFPKETFWNKFWEKFNY